MKDVWIEIRDMQFRKVSRGFAPISVAPQDLQVQAGAAAGSTVQIRLLDLTHRLEGCGYVQSFLSIFQDKAVALRNI